MYNVYDSLNSQHKITSGKQSINQSTTSKSYLKNKLLDQQTIYLISFISDMLSEKKFLEAIFVSTSHQTGLDTRSIVGFVGEIRFKPRL